MTAKCPNARSFKKKEAKDFVPTHFGDANGKVEEVVAIDNTGSPAFTVVMDHWVGVIHKLAVKTSTLAGAGCLKSAWQCGHDACYSLRGDFGASTEELSDILGIGKSTHVSPAFIGEGARLNGGRQSL